MPAGNGSAPGSSLTPATPAPPAGKPNATDEPDTVAVPPRAGTAPASAAAATAGAAGQAAAAPEEQQAAAGADRSAQAATPAATAAAATAAGRPLGDTRAHPDADPPSGNPKKPLLAAAGIAGVVLIAVPLLILANNDSDRTSDTVAVTSKSDTLLDENPLEPPPVPYAPAEPEEEEEPKEEPKEEPEEERPAAPPPEPVVEKPAETEEPEPKKKAEVVEEDPAEEEEEEEPEPVRKETRTFTVRSADTGKCLSAGQGKAGDPVVVWDCNGAQKQQWSFANDSSVRIGDKCLDLLNGSTAAETHLMLWHCNGTAGQKFRLNANDELIALNSGYCLDVWHGRTNGTRVTPWICNGQPNQGWSRR